jgi:hemolysin III
VGLERVRRDLEPPRWLSSVLYVGMGWLALVAFKPLLAAVPPEGIAWLVAGGLVYTLGALVYALHWPRLWPGRFGAHELWHVFVMLGSAVHFVFIARYAL